jgi:hypothetical protein
MTQRRHQKPARNGSKRDARRGPKPGWLPWLVFGTLVLATASVLVGPEDVTASLRGMTAIVGDPAPAQTRATARLTPAAGVRN